MSYYAILNGSEITGVVTTNTPPMGAVLLSAAPDWSLRPSPHHRLYLVDGGLVWQDVRSLAEAKTEKLRELRDAREAALNSTFTWDGSVFDADQVSQTRLMGLRLDAQMPSFTSQAWRLADNSWRVLSATDAAGVWEALKAHMAYQFTWFAAKEAQVLSSETDTHAKVAAIVW